MGILFSLPFIPVRGYKEVAVQHLIILISSFLLKEISDEQDFICKYPPFLFQRKGARGMD